MLSARATGFLGTTYEVTSGGRAVTTFSVGPWTSRLRFPFGGAQHEVRSKAFSSRWEVVANGVVVAVADGVGRKDWTLHVDGVAYEFRRTSVWTNEQVLLAAGRQVGAVRRTGTWKRGAEASFPGDVPLHVQVFALAVVLSAWLAAEGGANAG